MGNTCSYTQVAPNEGCWDIWTRCNITQAQLLEYNGADLCTNGLKVDQYVCCSPGNLPDFSPQPYENGTCYTYTAVKGDNCWNIAEAHHIDPRSTALEDRNANTWGWAGCAGLQEGARMCLSTGNPPVIRPHHWHLSLTTS